MTLNYPFDNLNSKIKLCLSIPFCTLHTKPVSVTLRRLQPIKGTYNGWNVFLHAVGVDFGGRDIGVAHEVLDELKKHAGNSRKCFSPVQWSLAFFALSCAWGHLLLALKIGTCPIAAKSRENAEYLMKAEPQDAFEQMFSCYVDATQEIESVIEKKSKNLELAYDELIPGASMVVAFIFLIIIMEVFKWPKA